MKSEILETCLFETKQPKECSEIEITNFCEKVLKGGKLAKVSLNGLRARIKNCELLAFCYLQTELVGVSSIKKPSQNYVESVIKKAKLDRQPKDLTYEIGYSFTEEKFRKNGISGRLKKELLEKIKSRKGKILFSTTAISSSQNFFEANGFVKEGISYDGENDRGITYYEIKL